MHRHVSPAVFLLFVWSLAGCSEAIGPVDDGTPVAITLGPPSTVPLLVASANRLFTLRGVDPASIAVESRTLNGSPRWKELLPSCQDACFIAADTLGNLYLSTATEVVSLAGSSGEVRWRTPIRGALAAVGSDGRVYVASRPFAVPQRVYALNGSTGGILWSTSLLPSLDATALLVDESRSFLYAVGRGRASTLSLSSGIVQRTTVDDCFGGSQGAVADDGTIYITCDNTASSRLTALNPGGTFKWTTSLGSAGGTTAPVIDAAGMVYVANSASLTGVRPDGTIAWRLTGLTDNVVSPAIASNNDVYIHAAQAGAPSSILVVNAGTVVEDKGSRACALSFLLTSTGRVYCASSGGFVFFQGRSADATGQWGQLGRDAQRGSRKP